jgi:cytochrome c oxidase assembly protein subunit 15
LPVRHPQETTPANLRRWMLGLGVLIFITLLSGGFVAGLKAGHAYNTFPLMNGQWVPEVIFAQQPLWRNFFENSATVQFDHRVLATLVFAGTLILWLVSGRRRLSGQIRIGIHLLMAAAVLQVTLGISTLLLHVPVALAATHQGGALLLFTVALYVNQRMRQKH